MPGSAKQTTLLSKREAQVMHLLIEGASTKTIARQLAISSKTVDNHRIRILQKVRVGNTVELTRLVFSTRRTGQETVPAPRAERPLVSEGMAWRTDVACLAAR